MSIRRFSTTALAVVLSLTFATAPVMANPGNGNGGGHGNGGGQGNGGNHGNGNAGNHGNNTKAMITIVSLLCQCNTRYFVLPSPPL